MIKIDAKLLSKQHKRICKMLDQAKPDKKLIEGLIRDETMKILKEAFARKFSFGCVLCHSPHKAPGSNMCELCLLYMRGLGKKSQRIDPKRH